MSFRPHNIYKLQTKEDPLNVHKLFGVICLLNYGYRYYLLSVKGTMDLNNNFAASLMCVHATLSCSSLIFHLPSIRNKTAPMIYPEYRLHSIIFALRSCVCYFLIWRGFPVVYNFAACYATMIAADFVSSSYKTNNGESTTMRDMPFDKMVKPEDQIQIIMIESSQQIGATLFMLGNLDSCFSPMFAIQFAAFLMTLVRKNIIDSNTWHLLYNLSLWVNAFCFWSMPFKYVIIIPVLFQVFYYWRFTTPREQMRNCVSRSFVGNKYIGWTIVFCIFYLWNPIMPSAAEPASGGVARNAAVVSYLAINLYRSKGFLLSIFTTKY